MEIQPYSASHQILGPRIWPDKGLGGEKLTGLAVPNGLVCLTLQQASWAGVFVKLNRESTSEFLKGIRSRGKASLVCESTEWKGCHEPPTWSCLCQVPHSCRKQGPLERKRSAPRQGWPASRLPPKLNFLILHLLTAGRSHSSNYAACGWAGLESRDRDGRRGLKHQVWGFYAPGCSPELNHFSGFLGIVKLQ